MATQRKKSALDIYAQAQRIKARLDNSFMGMVRSARVDEIVNRYGENMERTKAGQKAVADATTAMMNGNQKGATKIMQDLAQRKFTRRQYMGLSKG